MFDNVSVIIPIVRPDKAERAIEAVELHCPGVEIIAERDIDGIGCPKMVKKLTEKTTRDMVMFLGDDTIIKAGALQSAVKHMASLPDGWGVVGLCTFPGKENDAHSHWLAHKKMLPLLGGEFFSTEYEHCFCDNELEDITKEHGRWVWAQDAQIYHDHPIVGGEPDPFYDVAYGGGKYGRDRTAYYRRKRERKGGLLAIGFPLVSETVPIQFFTSYAAMNKPDQYILLMPQFPHGPLNGTLAEARNSLVFQALQEGASHLLMMDTDQTYPVDTLSKLASHEVDICGVRVHRRWMPFEPIFMRGDQDCYTHVSDDEMFSGKLIEVDATGTGCLLFNMSVFDRIKDPWFKNDFYKGKPVGEDFYFCNKVRKEGVKIHIDTSIEVGHLATIEVNKWLYKICKQIIHKQEITK